MPAAGVGAGAIGSAAAPGADEEGVAGAAGASPYLAESRLHEASVANEANDVTTKSERTMFFMAGLPDVDKRTARLACGGSRVGVRPLDRLRSGVPWRRLSSSKVHSPGPAIRMHLSNVFSRS